MRVVRGRPGSRPAVLSLEPVEAGLVIHLAEEVAALLSAAASGDDEPADPALLRLLPSGYADEESSREFRRFTAADLTAQKLANLARVAADLAPDAEDAPGPAGVLGTWARSRTARRSVELDGEAVGAWLRALTDLRLVLASRLGMDADGAVPAGDEGSAVHDVYDWLGLLQESIITALED